MSEPTQRLNPITHPTQIIRRLEHRAERRAAERGERIPPAAVKLIVRGLLACIGLGLFAAVLALLDRSPLLLLVGFLFLSAGFSLLTFYELVRPEVATWDEVAAAWINRKRGKQ